MDLEWILNGSSMNLEWIFNGTSMDFQWNFNGSSMDLQWIFNGSSARSSMDLQIFKGSREVGFGEFRMLAILSCYLTANLPPVVSTALMPKFRRNLVKASFSG